MIRDGRQRLWLSIARRHGHQKNNFPTSGCLITERFQPRPPRLIPIMVFTTGHSVWIDGNSSPKRLLLNGCMPNVRKNGSQDCD